MKNKGRNQNDYLRRFKFYHLSNTYVNESISQLRFFWKNCTKCLQGTQTLNSLSLPLYELMVSLVSWGSDLNYYTIKKKVMVY